MVNTLSSCLLSGLYEDMCLLILFRLGLWNDDLEYVLALPKCNDEECMQL